MMTLVHSRSSSRTRSDSRSCAAPRMPPRGFLISCAVHPLPVLMKRFLDINDFNQNTGVPAGGPAFGQARQHGLNADVVRLGAGMRPEQTPKHAGGLHGRPRRQMRIPLGTLRETVAKVSADKRSPRTSQQHFGRTSVSSTVADIMSRMANGASDPAALFESTMDGSPKQKSGRRLDNRAATRLSGLRHSDG